MVHRDEDGQCPALRNFSLQLPECSNEPWFRECEEDGDVCDANRDRCSLCGQMSEYLKMLVRAPTDKCSFMRMLMDPISQLDAYRKYARCKIELFGFVVGVVGALVCLYSFFQAPFYADVKSCFEHDNFECTTLWWIISSFLFVKDLITNIMGIVTNVALVIALQMRSVDCIYLWLVWRQVALTLNAISLPLMGLFTLSISQDLSWDIFMEAAEFLTNLLSLILIYAIYEKFAGCLEGDLGDEGAGEDFMSKSADEESGDVAPE